MWHMPDQYRLPCLLASVEIVGEKMGRANPFTIVGDRLMASLGNQLDKFTGEIGPKHSSE